GYLCEFFTAWYSGDPFDRYVQFFSRPLGPYRACFWAMIACNCLAPQLFWFARVRRSGVALVAVSLAIQLGMWLERFLIVVGSRPRDFLPSSWGRYAPTWVDWSLLAGSISCFLLLFLLFLRFVPFVPIAEVKKLRDEGAA